MPTILLQAGHSSTFPPFRTGGGGAPGEAQWTGEVCTRIAALLKPKGVDCELLGAIGVYVNGAFTIVNPIPPQVFRDYPLCLALHYESTGHSPDSGTFIARASGDPMGAEADRFIGIFKRVYPARTGIPLHQEWVTINMTDYHLFRYTSDKTPGVIAEAGIGQGLDHDTLFNRIDVVAAAFAECICEFLGIKWQEEAPVIPIVEPITQPAPTYDELAEALRVANWQKHEMERYIREPDHKAETDQQAAEWGMAPIDLLLFWAKGHIDAGEAAP